MAATVAGASSTLKTTTGCPITSRDGDGVTLGLPLALLDSVDRIVITVPVLVALRQFVGVPLVVGGALALRRALALDPSDAAALALLDGEDREVALALGLGSALAVCPLLLALAELAALSVAIEFVAVLVALNIMLALELAPNDDVAPVTVAKGEGVTVAVPLPMAPNAPAVEDTDADKERESRAEADAGPLCVTAAVRDGLALAAALTDDEPVALVDESTVLDESKLADASLVAVTAPPLCVAALLCTANVDALAVEQRLALTLAHIVPDGGGVAVASADGDARAEIVTPDALAVGESTPLFVAAPRGPPPLLPLSLALGLCVMDGESLVAGLALPLALAALV